MVQELHGSSSGRRALASWLGTEPAPPELEFEAMVRLTFAEGR